MIRLVFLICLFFNCNSIIAQTPQSLRNFAASFEVEKSINPEDYKNEYSGNPCLFEGWKEGVLKTKAGEEIKLQLTYMVYGQMILVNRGQNITKLTNPDIVDNIKVDGHEIIYKTIQESKNKLSNTFLLRLTKRKYSLCKKLTCDVEQPDDQRSPYDEKLKPKFVKKHIFYMIEDDKVGVQIPKEASEFYKIFGEKEDDVKEFCKKHKIKPKKRRDLIRFFETFNSEKK